MDTYTDTWGKMVKIQIVNHFRRNNNHILTVEPPFQNLIFEDAISPSPDKDTSRPSQYTEELHLQNRQPEIADIYEKLKQTFTNVKSALQFNPTKYYIGVIDRKQIAFIQIQKRKIRLVVLIPENEVKDILRSEHHKINCLSEAVQYAWGGPNPNCAVDIYDTNHWDEIQKLVAKLVEYHQEIKL
jgi:predicted transport protein